MKRLNTALKQSNEHIKELQAKGEQQEQTYKVVTTGLKKKIGNMESSSSGTTLELSALRGRYEELHNKFSDDYASLKEREVTELANKNVDIFRQ